MLYSRERFGGTAGSPILSLACLMAAWRETKVISVSEAYPVRCSISSSDHHSVHREQAERFCVCMCTCACACTCVCVCVCVCVCASTCSCLQ